MIYNKNNFIIASLCPGEYSRYYLDGVHVTPTYTEVTNGHYLMRVSAPFRGNGLKEALSDLPKVENHEPIKTKSEPFTVPAKSAQQVASSIPTNQRTLKQLEVAWITKNTNAEEVELVSYDLETVRPIKTRKLEGKWANTQAVINNLKSEKPQLTTGFNLEYMLKICQVFKKMKLRGLKIELYGEKKAMVMTGKTPDEQEVIAVLMPMIV